MSATLHYQDERITLWHGDALDVLRGMEDGSVDCVVTSPPYFGLRDYEVEGQIGLEESPAEYVGALRAIFAEVRRVLAVDGTLWLNLGDSYSGYHGNARVLDGPTPSDKPGYRENMRKSLPGGVPNKNLFGIPWRVAFALQDDGWILRNDIIWAKTRAQPFAGKDRLATRKEYVFLLTRRPRYFFDLDAIRETVGGPNPGDVWSIPPTVFREAHFATMSPDLALRCVRAGCKPGGVVLDPFSGAGTTGMAALAEGHRYIGIDLSAEYLDLSLQTRLAVTR